MNNNARVWTIGTVLFAVVTGLAVNFLYDWMKSPSAGDGDTSRSTSKVPAARLVSPSPDGSGKKNVGSTSISAPDEDD